ncbi:hypothetical protein M569_02036 [Genlisea aurea]|uniref:Pentatricopeptide repeat-containing protein n=1 Tax=Genlisea aurea TaxID=192259 RepID=S8D5K6_9LAMI|nr:hypothetical protein M569_02036 [Genlisea aurea]
MKEIWHVRISELELRFILQAFNELYSIVVGIFMLLSVTSLQQQFRFPSWLVAFCSTFFRPLDSSAHSSNESFYASVVNQCTHRSHLSQIHGQIYSNGMQNNGFIITKLINRCSDIGEIEHARKLFDVFPDKYIFLWNGIIRGYSKHHMLNEVVGMYSRMQLDLVNPDSFSLLHVLKACGNLMAVEYGRAVHGQVFRFGFEEDVFVQNELVLYYSKCRENQRAYVIFSGLRNKDIISWTCLISGYAQNLQPLKALKVFKDMTESYLKPDWVALVSVLKACSDLEEWNHGKNVHALASKSGFESEHDLGIALTSFYAKCGMMMDAKYLFDRMEANDVIIWNALISGFAKNGQFDEVQKLFAEMVIRSIEPDAITLQSTILAFSQHGSLDEARYIGCYTDASKFRDDTFVRSALIDMYAKCGSVELAREIFDSTPCKDVVVWSAMIMGYALHGHGGEAIDLFTDMKDAGIFPNDVTFLGLITACSHSSLVEEGWEIFLSMKDYGVDPRQKHYAGIVDMLSRAGRLERAFKLITSMPLEPGISVWGALLSGCEIHRRAKLGVYAAEKLFALGPLTVGHYVQLSNFYASAGMWDRVANIRMLMKTKRLNKESGISTIETNGKLQASRNAI